MAELYPENGEKYGKRAPSRQSGVERTAELLF
jgi:hypothetical protein